MPAVVGSVTLKLDLNACHVSHWQESTIGSLLSHPLDWPIFTALLIISAGVDMGGKYLTSLLVGVQVSTATVVVTMESAKMSKNQ